MDLHERLAAAGVPADAEPIAAWRRLRAIEGRRVTVIDLYRLVSGPRGLEPHELPLEERVQLARSVMPDVWPEFSVTHGSERKDPIRVVDYDPAWPLRFESWRKLLSAELGEVALRIEHVGSTSVAGLAAKPIVDIQVSVRDLGDEIAYVPPIERAGVQLRSRDVFHRYFRPFAGTPRDVHVHVCEAGSVWEREHLLFRDFLRAHPAARRRYTATKLAAVTIWADDGWAYTDAKAEVILDVLESAESWATATGWSP